MHSSKQFPRVNGSVLCEGLFKIRLCATLARIPIWTETLWTETFWTETFWTGTLSHWTYLLQILSQLCFQRVAFSGNYEIVAIFSDKTTIFKDLNYKADTGQHFHTTETSARRCHRHTIIKTNLKTHISLLLTRPQGYQKRPQDPLNMPVEVWCAKIAPKLKNI